MTHSLDPDVRNLIDELDALDNEAFAAITPVEARRTFGQMQVRMRGPRTVPPVTEVRDTDVPSGSHRVPVRAYRPTLTAEPADVVLYMHGGGWVVGDLDTADHTAREISRGLAANVVSVDYRLAPEHPFPAAFDDCQAVLEDLTIRYPDARISVAGDSAGGNLAAALALESRGNPLLRVDAQLLLYPALDPQQSLESHREFAEGYVLTRADMTYYWDMYVASLADRTNVRASPFAEQDLTGIAPALVVTAGFDPLRDEGQRYAERLVAAGVPVTYMPFPALIHGWLDTVGRVPAAQQALHDVLARFAAVLAAVHRSDTLARTGS